MDLYFDKSASAVRIFVNRVERAYNTQPVLTLFWTTFALLSFFPFLTLAAFFTIVIGTIVFVAFNASVVIFGVALLFASLLSLVFAFILAFAAGFTCSIIASVQSLRYIGLVRKYGASHGHRIWLEQFQERGILRSLSRSLDKIEPRIVSEDSEDTIYLGREEEGEDKLEDKADVVVPEQEHTGKHEASYDVTGTHREEVEEDVKAE